MARPREFDEDQVLERALEVFWTRGYEATSVADLMAAMGLAKGSVYKGFGDKKSLFLRTLDRYLERGRDAYRQLDGAERNAFDVLRAWLANAVEMATASGVRKGCFGVNCSVELAPHDTDVRKRMREQERRLEVMYEATLKRGIAQGSVRPELDTKLAARFITTTMAGILVAAKTGMSRSEAMGMVDLALSAMVAPPEGRKGRS